MAATPRSARFAYDVIGDALTEQLARIDSLDQKAGIILAAGGILGALVLAPQGRLTALPTWLVISTIITLVGSLLAALVSFANRRYEVAPTPERVAALAGANEDRLRWMFIGNMLQAVEVNRVKLRTKSWWLTGSQFALFATVLQLGAYSIWREAKG